MAQPMAGDPQPAPGDAVCLEYVIVVITPLRLGSSDWNHRTGDPIRQTCGVDEYLNLQIDWNFSGFSRGKELLTSRCKVGRNTYLSNPQNCSASERSGLPPVRICPFMIVCISWMPRKIV
jgi:hypothetical protein